MQSRDYPPPHRIPHIEHIECIFALGDQSRFIYFPTETFSKEKFPSLLQSVTELITKSDSLFYYKMRQLVMTKCDKCSYKVRQVLQSATEQGGKNNV